MKIQLLVAWRMHCMACESLVLEMEFVNGEKILGKMNPAGELLFEIGEFQAIGLETCD